MTEEPALYCSFCGKSQHEVEKLIAGPTVFICDECVGLSGEIIADARAKAPDTQVSGGTPETAAVRIWAWDALKGWGSGVGDTFKTWTLDQRIERAERLARWALGGPGFAAVDRTPTTEPDVEAIKLIDRLTRNLGASWSWRSAKPRPRARDD